MGRSHSGPLTAHTSLTDKSEMGKSALHVLAKRSTADFGNRDREREKRRKILKMCVQKLRDIDDPETVLCRAVLINNTFKSLKYAYRRVLKSDPPPVQLKDPEAEESDNEEEEEEEDVSTDESSNEDEVGRSDGEEADEVVMPSLTAESDSLDSLDSGCDIQTFNAESIVHSLMMPPLLSPQIEDITNCSFYDSFSLSSDHNSNSDTSNKQNDAFCLDTSQDTTASLKLTVLNDVKSGGDGSELDFCRNTDFSNCASTDIGNSLIIDNLLTEIVQG